MGEQLAAMLLQYFVPGFVGGYGGYRWAIRDTPYAERPRVPWQLLTSVASGIGAALLGIAFSIGLVMADPEAATNNLATVPLLLGLGLGIVITQRRLKRRS